MNPLTWGTQGWLVSVAGVIGALVAIITGWPVLVGVVPYAYRSELQDAQRTAAFNRISDLVFQINALRAGDQTDTVRDEIERKLEERKFLECTYHYTVCWTIP